MLVFALARHRLRPVQCALAAILGLLSVRAPAQVADKSIVRELNKLPVAAETRRLIRTAPQTSRFPNSTVLRLREYSRTEIRADGVTVAKYYRLTKVLREAGKDEAGEQAIHYQPGQQRVRLLLARTILPGGQTANVQPGRVYDRVTSSEYPLYPVQRRIDLSMLQIKPGAVVEVSYEITDFRPALPGLFEADYYMRDFEPCASDVMELVIPASLKLNIRATAGAKVGTPVRLPGNRLQYRWTAKYLEEVPSEPYMPPRDRLLPHIEVTTRLTWDSIGAWLEKRMNGKDRLPEEGRALLGNLIVGNPDKLAAMETVYRWVQENIRQAWVSMAEADYTPVGLDRVLREGYANALDASLLLKAMLSEAGIEAAIGFVDSDATDERLHNGAAFPSPSRFDHVVVRAKLDGKEFWLDPHTKNRGAAETPSSLDGARVLTLGPTRAFVDLPEPSENPFDGEFRTMIVVDAEGAAEIEYSTIEHRDLAVARRGQFRDSSKRDVDEGIRQFIKRISADAELLEYRHSDPKTTSGPFETYLKFRAPNWALKVGNVIVIKPDLEQSFSGQAFSPFVRSERRFPIEFSRTTTSKQSVSIELPDGYEILDAPATSNIRNEFLDRHYEVRVAGRAIQIDRWSKYRNATLPAGRYSEVKRLFDRLGELDRRLIVLRRAATQL